jgi:hypothetical protein
MNMNERQKIVAVLCDGTRTSHQVAELCGDNSKYVQKTMAKFDLPRLPQGARKGAYNSSWKGGRSIDLDGYVTTPCPDGYHGRKSGSIYEHRLVAGKSLGRSLRPEEVVDHIDGLHLHNHPSNLRVFSSNADHLKATISGKVPCWSEAGIERMNSTRLQRKESQLVDTYRQRKENGDVRMQQILLAALQLGIDSPFLLGTIPRLKKAGIVDYSHSSLKRALDDLYRKYA